MIGRIKDKIMNFRIPGWVLIACLWVTWICCRLYVFFPVLLHRESLPSELCSFGAFVHGFIQYAKENGFDF